MLNRLFDSVQEKNKLLEFTCGNGYMNKVYSNILFFFLNLIFFNFIFKPYNIVLVLPNIEMNPPQVYMCSPS